MSPGGTRAIVPDGRPPALLVARTAWVLVSMLAVSLFVLGVPSFYSELTRVCTRAVASCAENGFLSPTAAAELRDLGVSTGAYAAYNVALDVLLATVWCGTGVVIFLRRSDDRMALLASLALVTFGTLQGPQQTVTEVYSSLEGLPVFVAIVGFASIILFLYLFPDGRFAPGWMAVPAAVWVANDAVSLLAPNLYGRGWLETAGFLAFFVPALCAVGSQIYRYRRISGAPQRQQTKWVVFGLVGAFGGYLVLVAAQGLFFGFGSHSLFSTVFFESARACLFLLIPVSVGLAVTRSRLWNIDVLINRTLVYGTLTVSLVLVYAGSVAGLQGALRAVTGGTSQLAVVASTLAIAALFGPLRRRVQVLIDRRFYRSKYDARRTLESFTARLRDETDLDALRADLAHTAKETVQPEHVSVWLQAGGSMAGAARAGRRGA